MKKLSLFLVIILLFLSSQSYAATYYIDPNTGNDGNAGTKSAPWKTLIAKVNTLVAGVDGGIYRGALRP